MKKIARQFKHAIFTVAEIEKHPSGFVPAFNVLKYRLDNKIWALYQRTQLRTNLQNGVKVIFYVSGTKIHNGCFVAQSTIEKIYPSFPSQDLDKFVDKAEWYYTDPYQKIDLSDIKWFDNFVEVKSIRDQLELFSNAKPKKWGIYLQGGIIPITLKDYNAILKFSRL
jgi:hypothetical protein